MKRRTKKKPKVLRGPNPLRSDPTRTTTLRRLFMRAFSVRFDRLKKQITKLVAEEDAFGLDKSSFFTINYNPNQPRDNRGRWSSGGSSGMFSTQGKHTPDDMKALVAYLEKETGMKFKGHGSVSRGKTSDNDLDISEIPMTEAEMQAASDAQNRIEDEIRDKISRGEMTYEDLYGDAEWQDTPTGAEAALKKLGFEYSETMRWNGIEVDRFRRTKTGHTVEIWRPEQSGDFGVFNRSAIAMLEIEDQTLRERVGDIQDLLDPEDVIELEDTPHVTVRYGLQDMTPQKVRQLLSRYPRVWIKLGRLSLFENDDADVLKIDVQSEELHKVNRALGLHASENTHRQYIPHVTIAFLKKGTGRKYLHGLPQFFYGMELLFKTLTYSSSGREVTDLALNYNPEAPYGYCPICGAPGITRERRWGGNDRCENGHEYPSDSSVITTNKRWQFNTTPEQVQQFQRWLQQRFTEDIVAEAMQDMENAYWYQYIAEAYRKGAGKAFDDANARGLVDAEKQAGFYRGTKMEFLRSSFAQPVQLERVKTLAGRVMTELQGVTQSMATAMNRVLVDGLAQGKSPREVARELNTTVDKIGKNRALTIARTETIRAHAEGQLDSLTNLGIESVGVAVEWDTTGDGRVCPLCRPLDGIVLTVAEARGMLPRHPNCRCSWIPANVGEDGTKQKKQSAAIRAARDESIRAERGKGSLLEKKKATSWGGADKEFSKKRPKSFV